MVDPTTRLMWPELQDDHLENSRKVCLFVCFRTAERFVCHCVAQTLGIAVIVCFVGEGQLKKHSVFKA